MGRKTLRVVGVRDDDADQPPALVVEEVEVDAAYRSGKGDVLGMGKAPGD
jgi:hypothetical protein